MPGEVIAHAQFLEARERHRTADRAASPPVAVASDEPPPLDGQRAARAVPPRLGPAGRCRVPRPSRDR